MEKQQPSPFDEPAFDRTLALEVEGRKFWVPRDMLSIYSPVFKTMLYGNFAEANKDVIALPGKTAKDIEEILRCIIPMPVSKQIDRSNLELVLAFADEYQVAELRKRAADFIGLMLPRCPKGDLLYYLHIAAKWRMEVFKHCLTRCSQELDLDSLLALFKFA